MNHESIAKRSKGVTDMKLREIREEKNIGVNELGRLVGLSPSYISELERGLKTNPSKETMGKIALVLETPVDEIFFEKEETA